MALSPPRSMSSGADRTEHDMRSLQLTSRSTVTRIWPSGARAPNPSVALSPVRWRRTRCYLARGEVRKKDDVGTLSQEVGADDRAGRIRGPGHVRMRRHHH